MAAKTKKPTAKKAPAKKAKTVAVKRAVKKLKAPPLKKKAVKRQPKKKATPQVSAADSDVSAAATTAADDEEGRGGALNSISIVHVVVDNMTVFGLGSDQRIYKWDTKLGLWKLHKEGM